MANKRQKDRVTAAQFDQALLEEIQQKRGLNIPVNALSSAVTFCVMVQNRLFGVRLADKRTATFNEAFKQLMEDAQVERAQHKLQQEEAARQADNKIVMPGQRGFRSN